MRTILLSVFALSITGCLDEAPQPEQRSGVITDESIAQDPTLRDDSREQLAADYNAATDNSDRPLACETSADCPHGRCEPKLHVCILGE